MDDAACTAELTRWIVANPGDEAGWLAYAADLADNGYDDLNLIVQTFWPALCDSLAMRRSFDAVWPTCGGIGSCSSLRWCNQQAALIASRVPR